jgi:lytic cellulose monooxygenase (C1-hydroxylating)
MVPVSRQRQCHKCVFTYGVSVQVYMAPTAVGGADWTKIFSDGYDGSSWAVDRLLLNKGFHSVIIPDVPAGDYLLRGKIL